MQEVPYINLKRQHRALKEEILSVVEQSLVQGDFILGDKVEEFEKKFAAYCGSKYAIGVNSGTDALFLTMKARGIGPGDEVITAPNSFLATASAIVATGARPVFADIREDLNLDPNKIEEKITKNTKAIIPVHLTGKSADMTPILELAEKHNLPIIEDAAQSVGAEYRKKRIGSFGIAGCFSLHPLKTLNACGDAGVIVTDDEDLCRLLRQLRNIGLKNRDESDIWGFNSRLDSLQAAILTVKLGHLDGWLNARRKNAHFYGEYLSRYCDVPREGENEYCVYHTYIIQTDRRDTLQEFLRENGVGTRIHYPIPIHLQKAAKGLGYQRGDFPVCERSVERILSLPVYESLTQEELDYVIARIQRFFEKGKPR